MAKLGIIAGGGDLPLKIIESCLKRKKDFFVLALHDNAAIKSFENYAHQYIHIGQVSTALAILKENQVTEVVLAGHVKRPAFSKIKLDAGGVVLAGKITKAKLFGDNSVLSAVISFLEQHHLKVIGVEQILDNILAGEGVLGNVQPILADLEDIELGRSAAFLLGQLDIGQAVIVQDLHILGVEAAEGTESLIERCGNLSCKTKGGVLVKLKKKDQEVRVDLPSIGVKTIEQIYRAGLNGVAIQAGSSLIIDYEQVIRRANELAVFVTGIKVSN